MTGPPTDLPVSPADVTICLEPDAPAALCDAVVAGLSAYNRRHSPPSERTPLMVIARDAAGRIVGGLVGETAWVASGRGWFDVGMLWVADGAQGRGLGRRLLLAGEEEAIRRGCRYAYLDTAEFQARPFYERLGYVVVATIEDRPPGWREYHLRKELRAAEG